VSQVLLRKGSVVVGLLACVGFCALPARADNVENFYRGRTIDFYVGYSPGGGYDAYARLMAQHMGRFIPGAPQIVVHNMPGAGGRIAAGYVYSVAPKDGSALGTADQALPLEQAMSAKPLPFDTGRFNWIGNPDADNNVLFASSQSGIATIEDAKKREVTVGATGGSTSSQYPLAANLLLGTKFRIILGYPGGNDINLAIERGEVQARGSSSWVQLKASRPDWIRNKSVNILVQIGLSRAPDLPDVPLFYEAADDPSSRAVLKLLSAPVTIGRPIFTAPGVPDDRVAALRAAFDATIRDPQFLADATRAHLDINPVTGSALQSAVGQVLSSPPEILKRLDELMSSEVSR
jgi:tripartite-type tricarboxylate transporter receptor subunit TctC